MKIKEHIEDKRLTLSLEGSFDDVSSPVIEEKLDKIFEQELDSVWLDLARVDYISSAGIRVLIIAHKKAVKSDMKLYMGEMSNKVREILEMVGIMPLFDPSGRVD